jgi:hypothetical protein
LLRELELETRLDLDFIKPTARRRGARHPVLARLQAAKKRKPGRGAREPAAAAVKFFSQLEVRLNDRALILDDVTVVNVFVRDGDFELSGWHAPAKARSCGVLRPGMVSSSQEQRGGKNETGEKPRASDSEHPVAFSYNKSAKLW